MHYEVTMKWKTRNQANDNMNDVVTKDSVISPIMVIKMINFFTNIIPDKLDRNETRAVQ